MPAQDVRIRISGGTVSLGVWRRAMETSENDLPVLNDSQKEAAQRIGMAEAEYARGVLAEEMGNREQQEKGLQLAYLLGDILERTGQGWKLGGLIRKGIDDVWIAHLENAGAAYEVKIPLELVDDAVDSGQKYEKSRLESSFANQLQHAVVRKAS